MQGLGRTKPHRPRPRTGLASHRGELRRKAACCTTEPGERQWRTKVSRITLSRRGLLGLANGATAFSFWQRKAHTFSAAERYSDRVAAERIADRDAARRPILVDTQTHVWWRAGGIHRHRLWLRVAAIGRLVRPKPV